MPVRIVVTRNTAVHAPSGLSVNRPYNTRRPDAIPMRLRMTWICRNVSVGIPQVMTASTMTLDYLGGIDHAQSIAAHAGGYGKGARLRSRPRRHYRYLSNSYGSISGLARVPARLPSAAEF